MGLSDDPGWRGARAMLTCPLITSSLKSRLPTSAKICPVSGCKTTMAALLAPAALMLPRLSAMIRSARSWAAGSMVV